MLIACPACKLMFEVEGERITIPVHSRKNGDECFFSKREHTVKKPTTRDPARIRERTAAQMKKDEETRKTKQTSSPKETIVDYGKGRSK